MRATIRGVTSWLMAAALAIPGWGCGSTQATSRGPAGNGDPIEANASGVLAHALAPGASATIVNVWASWCGPCREEFPDLLRVRRAYADRGLRLVLVSADFEPHAARRYLDQMGVDFPTFIKTGNDMDFINGLHPAWGGALPATLVYDGGGRLRY